MAGTTRERALLPSHVKPRRRNSPALHKLWRGIDANDRTTVGAKPRDAG
jgi:hypothetical protein